MSGMLIDTHRVEQELATLNAPGADAVRGAVETELVVTVAITGSSEVTILSSRDGLIRDAAPLRFTPVVFPALTVALTRAPMGGCCDPHSHLPQDGSPGGQGRMGHCHRQGHPRGCDPIYGGGDRAAAADHPAALGRWTFDRHPGQRCTVLL